MCIGLLAGLGGLLLRRAPLAARVGVTTAVAHVVGSVVIKTIGLSAYYSMPVWALMGWRLLNYTIVGVVEAVLLYFLLRHPGIRRLLPVRKEGAQ